jgi:hypothetical protein
MLPIVFRRHSLSRRQTSASSSIWAAKGGAAA